MTEQNMAKSNKSIIIFAMLNAIKEQQKQIEELKARIAQINPVTAEVEQKSACELR